MIRILLICTTTGLLLSGCKIVQKAPASGGVEDDGVSLATSAGNAPDPVAEAVEASYEAQLLPHVEEGAIDVNELKTAIEQGLEAAGAAHGVQAAGGGAWNFLTKGQGVVVAADLEARAATLDVDTDGDGEGDAQIQLGPVVKGTALRDASPFYVFTDFRDQIEFAALARALNTRAVEALEVPEGDLVGRVVSFEGAFALRSGNDPIQVVPTRLTLEGVE